MKPSFVPPSHRRHLGLTMELERLLNVRPLKIVRDAGATIRSIALFATLLLAGGGYLTYLVSARFDDTKVLAGTAVAEFGLLLLAATCFRYYSVHYCDPAPYEILRIEGLLIIEPVGGYHRYTNTRRQTIKVLRDNVRLVEHRSHFTGRGSRGKNSIESLMPGHDLFVARAAEEDGGRRLWIYPGRPLFRGDVEEVGIRQVFEDNIETMKPYYRKGGNRFKTREISIAIRFVLAEDPLKIDGLVWNNGTTYHKRREVGTIAPVRTVDRLAGTVEYQISVPKAKPHHAYGFRWVWPDGSFQKRVK